MRHRKHTFMLALLSREKNHTGCLQADSAWGSFKKGRTDASISEMRSWKASGSSSSSTERCCLQYACSTCMRNEACWCMKLCRVSLAASSAGDRGGPWALTTCPSSACTQACLRCTQQALVLATLRLHYITYTWNSTGLLPSVLQNYVQELAA